MKNPGCANNRGSPPYISRNSSYQIPLSSNAPLAMIFKAKTACGDDNDSTFNTGLCSDFYVSKRVTTPRCGTRLAALTRCFQPPRKPKRAMVFSQRPPRCPDCQILVL